MDCGWDSDVDSVDCMVDIYVKILCVKLCVVGVDFDLICIYCGLGYVLEV